MGIFRNERHRLLRTNWGTNADLLAQEIYAMLLADDVQIDGQLTIVNDTFSPALTIATNKPGGNTEIVTKSPERPEDDKGKIRATIPAKIIAGGPGTKYTAELYGNGPDEGSTGTVEVTALQLDPAEMVPPNTWIMAIEIGPQSVGVLRIPAKYFFQPPVWL